MQRLMAPCAFRFREKASVFLTELHPAADGDTRTAILGKIRKRDFDATHHCSAWRSGCPVQAWGADDDGEPAGTAPDAVAQALRWMGRSAALLLAVLGAGLALRAGAAFARPGSVLARLNGAMLLAASAWVGVIAIVLAGLAARL